MSTTSSFAFTVAVKAGPNGIISVEAAGSQLFSADPDAHVYEIELPRPRTVEMTFKPEFIEMIQEIKHTVESGGNQAIEIE